MIASDLMRVRFNQLLHLPLLTRDFQRLFGLSDKDMG